MAKLDVQKARDLLQGFDFGKLFVEELGENFLTGLLLNNLGKDSAALISITFHELDGKDVCKVEAKKSPKPVFVTTKAKISTSAPATQRGYFQRAKRSTTARCTGRKEGPLQHP